MPHIHTEPGQHDVTVSAYVVLWDGDGWSCLVHLHKKVQKLMQIGGHLELDETPWQAIAKEVLEESGYLLGELNILQYTKSRIADIDNIYHPTPFMMNTHNVGDDHFHSDMCFGFVAEGKPSKSPTEGESEDLRWLSLSEIKNLSENGEALKDLYYMYNFLLNDLSQMVQVPACEFSLEKPKVKASFYKIGNPGEDREK